MVAKRTASFWNNKIIQSSRGEKNWRLRGESIVQRYRNEGQFAARHGATEVTTHSRQTFNILFSNTQTIKPAVYSATPKPDVRKRFKDDNPIAGEVAELLERAVSFSIDAYDFDSNIEKAVDDQLLPGRGTVRVRYIPSFRNETVERKEEGLDEFGETTVNIVEEETEVIADEEVVCEYVYWEDYRMGAARNWDDVPWVSFRHKFTKEEFEEEFGGEHTKKADFSFSVEETEDSKSKSSDSVSRADNLAVVWEIWDKETRKVYWITKGVSSILEESEDPLNLKGFFPVPAPLYAVETTDTLVPVPLYSLYEDLAQELNLVQKRILALTNGLKLRGIYPNNMEEIQGMLQLGDNQMLGVKDFTSFEGRNLKDMIMFAPIEEIAQVISVLTAQREQIKQVIFEVTGISDILRGTTKASETLGAQQIKASFGTARLENLLKKVRVFARDLIRMKAEIIAEKFQPQTLQLMTGVEVTEPMLAMMRSDVLRTFNIDIETDSTVAIDKSGEKEEARETLAGIVQFMTGIAPLVQGGAIPIDVAKDLLLWAIRSSGGGKTVEDAIDRIGEQPQVPQGIPQGGLQ